MQRDGAQYDLDSSSNDLRVVGSSVPNQDEGSDDGDNGELRSAQPIRSFNGPARVGRALSDDPRHQQHGTDITVHSAC